MTAFRKFFYEADQTLYHGTKKDFDWFELGKGEELTFDTALGTHFSHTPAIANKFALENPTRPLNRGPKYGGRVIPAKVEGEIYDIQHKPGNFDAVLVTLDGMKTAFDLKPELEKQFHKEFIDYYTKQFEERVEAKNLVDPLVKAYFNKNFNKANDRFGSDAGVELIVWMKIPVAKQILDVYKNHLLSKGYGLIRYVNTGKYERKGLRGEDLYSYIALKNPKSIFEMAKPNDAISNMIFWHGTPTESAAKEILKNGIKVSEVISDESLTPVLGANYVTPDIAYAAIYGVGGDLLGTKHAERPEFISEYGPYFYLFEIKGNRLKDVQPDEDSIGEMLFNKTAPKWLSDLAVKNLNSRVMSGVMNGSYDYWAIAGKILVKKMSDDQKLDLIVNHNSHVANFEIIYPDYAYKISRRAVREIEPDASNILDFAEKIKLNFESNLLEDEGLEEDDNNVTGNFQKWYGELAKKNQNNLGRPIHPKTEGVINFWEWFGDSKVVDEKGRPIVCYHGTAKEFEDFNTNVIWFSTDPKLSSEYADIRGMEVGSTPANIVAYIKAENPFYSSEIKKNAVKAADFFVAMDKQSNNKFSVKLKELLDIVKRAAIKEESGPYYSIHDFWFLPREMFGKTGAAAITEAFRVCGFDSIYFVENGIPTWGVFDQKQIKSAIGNNGNFSANSSKITEKKRSVK